MIVRTAALVVLATTAASAAPDLGPAGRPVAWQHDLHLPYGDTADLSWADDGIVIVRYGENLVALRDDQELWSLSGVREAQAVGNRVVVETKHALTVRIAKSGGTIATPADEDMFSMTVADGKVLAVTANRRIVTFDVASCRVTCDGQQDFALPDVIDPIISSGWAYGTPDGIVVADSDRAVLLDRKGEPRMQIAWGPGVMFGGFGDIIFDRDAVLVLSYAACAKLGRRLYLPPQPEDCKGCRRATGACIAHRTAAPGGASRYVHVPGGAAFNDNATPARRTHLLDAKHDWATPTDARAVAVDGDSVYVVTQTDEGPVSVVALDRETGKPRWHTELAGIKYAGFAEIAVRDGRVAVMIYGKVWVL